jgi:hypothetical protein
MEFFKICHFDQSPSGLVLGEMVKQSGEAGKSCGGDGELKGEKGLSVKSFSTFYLINTTYAYNPCCQMRLTPAR